MEKMTNEDRGLPEPGLDPEGTQTIAVGDSIPVTEAEYNAHIAFNNTVQDYYEAGRIDPTQIEEIYIH